MGMIGLSIVVGLLAICPTRAQHRLWYDRPAQTWTQALPVGNGVIGGMVFGTPAVEHIQLNEETLWAGQPNQVLHPEAKENLPKVRQLLISPHCCSTDTLLLISLRRDKHDLAKLQFGKRV